MKSLLPGLVILSSILISSVASELTAPFIFYSTAPISLPSLPLHNTTTNDIHHFIGGAFSTCPTSNYLVVYQPGIQSADYDDTSLTPNLHSYATSSTGIKVRDVEGQVWLDGIMNTILMDCLNHGITRVENLDVERMVRDAAKYELPLGGPTYLETEERKKSILYAHMPKIEWIGQGRREAVKQSDDFVLGVVEQWFSGEDFTIAYITEPVSEDEVKEYEELLAASGYDVAGEPLGADWKLSVQEAEQSERLERPLIIDEAETPFVFDNGQ